MHTNKLYRNIKNLEKLKLNFSFQKPYPVLIGCRFFYNHHVARFCFVDPEE